MVSDLPAISQRNGGQSQDSGPEDPSASQVLQQSPHKSRPDGRCRLLKRGLHRLCHPSDVLQWHIQNHYMHSAAVHLARICLERKT